MILLLEFVYDVVKAIGELLFDVAQECAEQEAICRLPAGIREICGATDLALDVTADWLKEIEPITRLSASDANKARRTTREPGNQL